MVTSLFDRTRRVFSYQSYIITIRSIERRTVSKLLPNNNEKRDRVTATMPSLDIVDLFSVG